MNKLSNLPNISSVMESLLEAVDINNAEELQAIGSKKAFIRLHTMDESSCINKLYAIEGAIQGIRWHGLDKETKLELKQFLNELNMDR